MLDNFYTKKFIIYSIHFIYILFFIIGLYNYIFSFKNFLLINFILFIHYTFFIFFIKNEESNNYFPILPLISAYFFFTYTLSFFISKKEFFYQDFNSDVLTKSIFIIILGLLSLFFGYFIAQKFFSLREKKIFYFEEINLNKKKIIFLLFLTSILFIYYIEEKKIFPSVTIFKQLKEPLILFILGLALLMLVKKEIKLKYFCIPFILLLSAIFFIEISRGAVVFIFSTILFLCTIYYTLSKKIPIFAILFIIFLGIFIHSVKYEIRDSIWYKNNLTSLDKIYITKNIILQNLSLSKFKNTNYSNINNHRLFHSINSLNIVSKFTPEKINFFQGASYKDIYTKFIPRFIWKEKPVDEQGNFWGHRYLVLNPEDKSTSWNFPVLNEFYANFGIPGVFIGMFFLGFLIKLLILKLWKKNISDIEILISSIIIFNFFYLENNLSQILGKIINQLFFFHIIFIFIYLFFLFISKFKKKVGL
jgi:hypothetical protein